MALYKSIVSLNYLQYFWRYAPDESVIDGRKDRRTDGWSDGRTKRLYALPAGNIEMPVLRAPHYPKIEKNVTDTAICYTGNV